MEIYILKSAACLGIFFLFYKLLLEKTALHTTKRIYLLTSLVISIVIPFITFTQYVEAAPVTQMVSETFVMPILETTALAQEPINYTPHILWSIYGLGVLFFGFRFGKNLFSLFQKVKHNPLFKEKSIWYVLLQLPVTPHSFFNYIFFDKEAYEAGNIPEEVMVHEQAHVTQKHSWDILFFEIFQIVFWFNPLLYFFKKSIKLNHEFLADRTVLQTGASLSNYQNILLDFSNPDSYRDCVPEMAHSINYSSIKKRFNVMKTHTSRRSAWGKGLLVLPLLAVLIYGFSETKQEFIAPEMEKETITVTVDNEKTIWVNSTPTNFENLKNTLKNAGINPEKKYYIAKIIADKSFKIGFITDIRMELYSNGIQSVAYLDTINNNVSNTNLKQTENLSTNELVKIKEYYLLEQASPPLISLYNRTAEKYNSQALEERKITSVEFNILNSIHQKMSLKQRKNNQPFPISLPENIPLTGKAYYDKLLNGDLKDINSKSFTLQIELSKLRLNGVPVKLKDFTKAVDKYTKDWEETDYTSVHPNVLIASTPKSFLDQVDAAFRKTHFSKANGGMNIVPPTPPMPPTAPKVIKGEKSNISPPPTSEPIISAQTGNPWGVSVQENEDISVEELIANMEIKKATFWMNNKEISAKEALNALNTNPDAYYTAQESFDGKAPKVTIESDPYKYIKKGEESNIPTPPPPSMGDITKKFEYSYVLYVNGESIYLNGKRTSLSNFAKAMDTHTKNWPDAAFKLYGVSTKKENVSDAFIVKLNREYRKTKLAKNSSSNNPYVFSTSDSELPPPPPPPPGPEKPLDHVIAMAKRNATFYFEYIEITSDRAIELIKNNPNLNIQTRLQDPKPPKVYISNKGIKTEKMNFQHYNIPVDTSSLFKKELNKLNKSGLINGYPTSLLHNYPTDIADKNKDIIRNGIKTNQNKNYTKTIKKYDFPEDTKNAETAINILLIFKERNAKFSFNSEPTTWEKAKNIMIENPNYSLSVTEYDISMYQSPEVEITSK